MYVCRDAIGQMTDAEEGALSGWARLRHRIHMTICTHCRACRRQFEEARALAREIPAEPAPPAVEDAAMRAFRARRKDV